MNFLAPALLALGAAAAVPLLLHLMRRRIARRIDFPAARYLLRAERENSRRLRLRNLLLMLLRVAAVLLIAAAAARPVGRIAGTGHAPTAVAIVLDNTLSTTAVVGGRPNLDRLKDAARAAVDRASSADRLWLVTADGAVLGGSADAVRSAIDRAESIAGGADLPSTIRRAIATIGGASVAERRLAIASDGQAASWHDVVNVGAGIATVLFVPGDDPPRNRGVAAVAARPTRWTPRGDVVARVIAPDSATYRIELGGRTLARGTASPGEEILVRASPPERGWVEGLIELQPDEMRGDDIRYFAVWLGAAPAVQVDASAGAFLRSAADALRDAGRIVAGSDIVVTSADALSRLPALIAAPSDPVRVGAANRALERAGIPWRFGVARRGSELARAASDSPEWTAAEVTVALRYALERRTAAPSDTLVVAGGEPWIVAGDGYVLVASPLEPEATTFPIRAVFVPWLGGVLTQRLGGDVGPLMMVAPRASIARPAAAEELETPDGQRLTLTAPTLTAPTRPGVSFFRAAGRRIGAVVVNPDTAESTLNRMTDDELAARIPSASTVVTRTGDAWAAAVFGGTSRRSLTTVFLIAAIVALLAEVVLARSGIGRLAS